MSANLGLETKCEQILGGKPNVSKSIINNKEWYFLTAYSVGDHYSNMTVFILVKATKKGGKERTTHVRTSMVQLKINQHKWVVRTDPPFTQFEFEFLIFN